MYEYKSLFGLYIIKRMAKLDGFTDIDNWNAYCDQIIADEHYGGINGKN